MLPNECFSNDSVDETKKVSTAQANEPIGTVLSFGADFNALYKVAVESRLSSLETFYHNALYSFPPLPTSSIASTMNHFTVNIVHVMPRGIPSVNDNKNITQQRVIFGATF